MYVTYGLLTCNDIYVIILSQTYQIIRNIHYIRLNYKSQHKNKSYIRLNIKINYQIILLIQLIKYRQTLNTQELEKQEKEKKRVVKQKKREYFSYKEKDGKKQKLTKEEMAKQKKLLKEVQDELQEGKGDLDKKILAKNNGEILQKYIYFKVLKFPRVSKYYESALNVILQYVHLINIELIQGIFGCLLLSTNILRQKKDNLFINLRLKTIFALQSIMDGTGSVFGIDKQFKDFMFVYWTSGQIKKIIITEEEESLILRIFDSAFIKE